MYSAYYPEMGETKRGAMIEMQTCLRKMSCKWRPENDAEVMATFRRLRIRPAHVKRWTATDNTERCSCLITYAAADKLEKAADCETMILLD